MMYTSDIYGCQSAWKGNGGGQILGSENRRGPGQRRAAGLAFWPAKEGENVTHQRVDGGVTLCGSREDRFLGLNELRRNKLAAA
jgi:hypothetical protein